MRIELWGFQLLTLLITSPCKIGEEQKPGYEETLGEMNSDIAAAFCALAEVYMTDLCDVEDAQETCLTLMHKALDYNPRSAQALQVRRRVVFKSDHTAPLSPSPKTLASVHMSMAEPDEARTFLDRSLALWLRPEKSSEKDGVDGEDDADDDEAEDAEESGMDVGEDELDELPPYEFRINTAKLLLELGDTQRALVVLEQLLLEDDEIMQVGNGVHQFKMPPHHPHFSFFFFFSPKVWYLRGWALYMCEDDECVESLDKAKQLYVAKDCDRPEVLEHIEELLGQHATGRG